jgi:endonuclease YncB( thermonuclease family)
VRSTPLVGAFALGLLAGAMIAPVTAGRSVGEALPVSAAAPIRGAYAAELLRVIDGDTFEARVQVWPGLAVTTKVRLRGIDAPEMYARCAEERTKGEAARAALTVLLAEPDLLVFRVSLDKYGGRVLAAAATAHTSDVSQALLGSGAVRPHGGGRREPGVRPELSVPHFARTANVCVVAECPQVCEAGRLCYPWTDVGPRGA